MRNRRRMESPGGRRPGMAGLAAGLAALAIACQGCPCPRPTHRTADTRPEGLYVELEVFNRESADWRPAALTTAFEASGLVVNGFQEGHSLAAGSGTCYPPGWIDEMLRVTRGTSELRWYAHGLQLPGECVKHWDGRDFSVPGLAWFLPDESGELGYREAFVVLEGAHRFSPANTECTLTNPELEINDKCMTHTTIHELAHVLNIHHCELNREFAEYLDPLGEYPTRHLQSRVEFEDHVRPGGDSWCVVHAPHETDIHEPLGGCSFDCTDPWSAAAAAEDAPDDVTLILDADVAGTRPYLPGEPILVKVRLEAGGSAADPVFLRHENDLFPSFGNLTLAAGDVPEQLRPLPRPLLLEPAGERPVKMVAGEKRTLDAVDAWFALPEAWFEWDQNSEARTLWLAASFKVFRARNPASGRLEKMQEVRSEPIRITIDVAPEHPELFHPDAHARFIHWEARRFLWMLGGNHLTTGIRNLQEIRALYPTTIYAAYADLALGSYLSQPRLESDPRRKSFRVSGSDPMQALLHLLAARQRRTEFPAAYRRLLDERIAVAQQELRNRP